MSDSERRNIVVVFGEERILFSSAFNCAQWLKERLEEALENGDDVQDVTGRIVFTTMTDAEWLFLSEN